MRNVGVIDIGTNSIRLAVIRILKNHDYRILAANKEVVRLGEGEFSHNKITSAAMERGILVLRKFTDIARSQDATEIFAVATAAVREAENRTDFLNRARGEANLDVKVVSGVEEARLIYLGISSGVHLDTSSALFIDIGGGTTELIVGDARDYSFLDSLKLGAIRLSDRFLHGNTSSISKKQYRKMLDYAQVVAIHSVKKIRELGFDTVYGSSGTIMNLAEITAKRTGNGISSIRNYYMKREELTNTIELLCSLDLEKRRSVPGINPERADIIISGAAILDAILTGTGAAGIRISDRAMRDGIIIDHLFQEDTIKERYLSTTARQRSIQQLCTSCQFEEGHALKVGDLAESMFDQLSHLGLHSYGAAERELLRHASLVHDIGTFISYGDHHKHSYYMVRNWNLLGFDDEETEIIATTALCHRKLRPEKVRPTKLSPQSTRTVAILSSILRIADALDRSQLGLVREVILRPQSAKKRLTLEVYASEDCPLEMWAFENKKRLFEESFDTNLSIKRIST